MFFLLYCPDVMVGGGVERARNGCSMGRGDGFDDNWGWHLWAKWRRKEALVARCVPRRHCPLFKEIAKLHKIPQDSCIWL